MAEMRLERIEAPHVVEMATNTLLSTILEGGLKPGDEMPPQAELVRKLGISRVSIREAIQRLVALRVVEVHRGKRMVVGEAVRRITVADAQSIESSLRQQALAELVELRAIIEPELAALAAVRATDAHLLRLAAIFEELRSVKDPETALSLNSEFHSALVEAAGNQAATRLIRWLEDTSAELYQDLYNKLYKMDPERNEAEQHAMIYQAVLRRDTDGIRRLVREHVAESLLDEIIKTYGRNE